MKFIGVGTRLYGYCNGYFGRDSYDEKTIVALGEVGGKLWIVANENNYVAFASGMSMEDIQRWSEEEDWDL
jgi:hypothetical protein